MSRSRSHIQTYDTASIKLTLKNTMPFLRVYGFNFVAESQARLQCFDGLIVYLNYALKVNEY
jgi:subtilase family serine protease